MGWFQRRDLSHSRARQYGVCTALSALNGTIGKRVWSAVKEGVSDLDRDSSTFGIRKREKLRGSPFSALYDTPLLTFPVHSITLFRCSAAHSTDAIPSRAKSAGRWK